MADAKQLYGNAVPQIYYKNGKPYVKFVFRSTVGNICPNAKLKGKEGATVIAEVAKIFGKGANPQLKYVETKGGYSYVEYTTDGIEISGVALNANGTLADNKFVRSLFAALGHSYGNLPKQFRQGVLPIAITDNVITNNIVNNVIEGEGIVKPVEPIKPEVPKPNPGRKTLTKEQKAQYEKDLAKYNEDLAKYNEDLAKYNEKITNVTGALENQIHEVDPIPTFGIVTEDEANRVVNERINSFSKEVLGKADVDNYIASFGGKIDETNFRLMIDLFSGKKIEIPGKEGQFFTPEQVEQIKNAVLTPEVVEKITPDQRIEFVNIVRKELKDKIDKCVTTEQLEALEIENNIVLKGTIEFVGYVTQMRSDIFRQRQALADAKERARQNIDKRLNNVGVQTQHETDDRTM